METCTDLTFLTSTVAFLSAAGPRVPGKSGGTFNAGNKGLGGSCGHWWDTAVRSLTYVSEGVGRIRPQGLPRGP